METEAGDDSGVEEKDRPVAQVRRIVRSLQAKLQDGPQPP